MDIGRLKRILKGEKAVSDKSTNKFENNSLKIIDGILSSNKNLLLKNIR